MEEPRIPGIVALGDICSVVVKGSHARQVDSKALGVVPGEHLQVHVGEEFAVSIPDLARVADGFDVPKRVDVVPVVVMIVQQRILTPEVEPVLGWCSSHDAS
jgi:hypothetical protein